MFRGDVRMAELIAANPDLEQQMRDWQTERHQRGENPFDWQAFRVMVSYVGASDPGSDPPPEFFWFAPTDGGGMHVPELVVDRSEVPSARLVSPGHDIGAAGSDKEQDSGLTEMKYWR